jgi:hypothetical protein
LTVENLNCSNLRIDCIYINLFLTLQLEIQAEEENYPPAPSELPNDLIQRHSPRRKRTVASSVIDTSRSRRTLKTSRKEVPINYDSAIAIAKLVSWWCYVFNSIVNLGRFLCLLFTNISTKVKERCSFNKKIIVLGTDH